MAKITEKQLRLMVREAITSSLTNEEESEASKQAKQMNLTSDGWGRWKDQTGNVVAKTVDGKLVKIEKDKDYKDADGPKSPVKTQPTSAKDDPYNDATPKIAGAPKSPKLNMSPKAQQGRQQAPVSTHTSESPEITKAKRVVDAALAAGMDRDTILHAATYGANDPNHSNPAIPKAIVQYLQSNPNAGRPAPKHPVKPSNLPPSTNPLTPPAQNTGIHDPEAIANKLASTYQGKPEQGVSLITTNLQAARSRVVQAMNKRDTAALSAAKQDEDKWMKVAKAYHNIQTGKQSPPSRPEPEAFDANMPVDQKADILIKASTKAGVSGDQMRKLAMGSKDPELKTAILAKLDSYENDYQSMAAGQGNSALDQKATQTVASSLEMGMPPEQIRTYASINPDKAKGQAILKALDSALKSQNTPDDDQYSPDREADSKAQDAYDDQSSGSRRNQTAPAPKEQPKAPAQPTRNLPDTTRLSAQNNPINAGPNLMAMTPTVASAKGAMKDASFLFQKYGGDHNKGFRILQKIDQKLSEKAKELVRMGQNRSHFMDNLEDKFGYMRYVKAALTDMQESDQEQLGNADQAYDNATNRMQ
jgi:hypothetical protein